MLVVFDRAVSFSSFSNWCACVVTIGARLLVAGFEVRFVVLVDFAVEVKVLSFTEDVESVGAVVVAWGRGSESS